MYNGIEAAVMLSEKKTGPIAYASVIYGKYVRIDGFTVLRPEKEGGEVRILPPPVRNAVPGDRFPAAAYGNNAQLREEIERKIKEEYKLALERSVEYPPAMVHIYRDGRESDKSIVAHADVMFGSELVTKGWLISKNDDGSISVRVPEVKYIGTDGNVYGRPIVGSLQKGLLPQVFKAVREAYEEEAGKENSKFMRDYDQQKDDIPATYIPAELAASGKEQHTAAGLESRIVAEEEDHDYAL